MDLLKAAQVGLGLGRPWKILSARLEENDPIEIVVEVVREGGGGPCPTCSRECPGYDSQRRRWRHLDMWEFRTWIEADVPRVECKEHGIQQIKVPWAEVRSRFTAPFECRVIDWLLEASVTAVARNMGVGWKAVFGIQARAVTRGLARRPRLAMKRIGVDETSFQKRHEYVTIVTDQESGKVLYVADDRKTDSLKPFFEGLDRAQLEGIKVVSMDMHWPYLKAAATYVPELESKLCFDRFHVAQHFGKAVDQARRAENKKLLSEGDGRLKGTKYHWLKNPKNLPKRLRSELNKLVESSLLVAQVWAVKEAASKLWNYKSRTWAKKAWIALLEWAETIESPPLQRVVGTISKYLLGILNAIVLKATNAGAESINSKVQSLKRRANGYRNRARFRDAIMFHLGGLSLYPAHSTHTNG